MKIFSNRVVTWTMLLVGEALLATLTAGMFWFQDWQYSLPAPRPAALVQPAIGEVILLPELPRSTGRNSSRSQPTLLHFFNPNCPCSRFNLDHVRDLLHQYGDQVRVIAVLQADDELTAREQFEKLRLPCPALFDEQGKIAQRVGVYATPQGVLLDGQRRLFYRGNYNRGRYCTALDTQFVRLAVEACVANRPPPNFPAEATVAVGCALPFDRQVREEGPLR